MDEFDVIEAEFGFKSSKAVAVTRTVDTKVLDFRYRQIDHILKHMKEFRSSNLVNQRAILDEMEKQVRNRYICEKILRPRTPI